MQDEDLVAKLLTEFDAKRSLLEAFAEACERLVAQILGAHGIRVHSVNSRVKRRENLQEKIVRIGKDYQSLDEVTDLVGIRIITYFEDEVDRVATIIEQEFKIDNNKSIDKRNLLDPDRFGYLSLHYICSISTDRALLVEYKQFADLICEIQIRSILQHAWAEIEHDLGYKSGSVVPVPVRRRFSRLASLLELADAEFMQIRNELTAYSREVTHAVSQQASDLPLDDISLQALIKSDRTVQLLDREMAEFVGADLEESANVQRLLAQLNYVGLTSVSDVRKALESKQRLVLKQFKERLKNESHTYLSKGISLFHLFQVILVELGGSAKVEEAFRRFGIGRLDQATENAAEIEEAVTRCSSKSF